MVLVFDNQAVLKIGPVELAAVGVSIAVFNQVSKIAIFPLVSITTSFVAEEDAAESLSTEADDNGVLNKVYATNQEMELEDLIPQVGVNFIFLPFLFLLKYTFGISAIIQIYLEFLFFLKCNI